MDGTWTIPDLTSPTNPLSRKPQAHAKRLVFEKNDGGKTLRKLGTLKKHAHQTRRINLSNQPLEQDRGL